MDRRDFLKKTAMAAARHRGHADHAHPGRQHVVDAAEDTRWWQPRLPPARKRMAGDELYSVIMKLKKRKIKYAAISRKNTNNEYPFRTDERLS